MHFLGLTFNYKECQPKMRTYCGGGVEWPFLFNIVQKYISQELKYNFATICFLSRDLYNHQAKKLRVCALEMFSAGGRKKNRTISIILGLIILRGLN